MSLKTRPLNISHISNEIQMKKLYRMGYHMVRSDYIKEKNKAMDPKEKKSKGHYQTFLDLSRHFSKMSFNERKEHAFKMYRDLTSSKEKFAVALAFGYGPNVVFNTNVQEASKRWRCTIVAPREARSSSVTHLISPKPSTPRAFSAGPNPLNHER